MGNTGDVLRGISDPFLSVENQVAAHLPSVIAAFLLLLLGLFVARALRVLVEGAMNRVHFDEYASKVGVNEVLLRLGFGKSPAYVLGFLTYWFILFLFIVSAANAVDMTMVSSLLERFALFMPALIACVLILFGGLLFARFLSEVVANAARANNIRGGAVMAQGCYIVVVVFTAMTALEQLGIHMELVSTAIQILIASAGLAAAIAFGLGGKEVAAEILRSWFHHKDR